MLSFHHSWEKKYAITELNMPNKTNSGGGKPSKRKGTPRRNSTRNSQADKRLSSGSLEKKKEREDGFKPPRRSSAPQFIDGRVDIHPDGFGFLIPFNSDEPNVYIGKENLKDIMNRDEVRVQVTQSFSDGKLRGSIVDILKRHQTEFLGFYRPHGGGVLLVPLEARDRNHVFKMQENPNFNAKELKPGSAVLCKILEYPSKVPGKAQITRTIEDPESAGMDTLRVLLDASWPREFTPSALSYAENQAERWTEKTTSRKDIRDLPLVTIDGRDARDFDDAVYAKREGENIRLWVAIADVSLFVEPGTALDKEAFERSTSVYFPDHVTPMLPEVLSNGVCSLVPNEDRPCMVCECVINDHGIVKDYHFFEGVMRSHKRMTYEMMQAFIDKEEWVQEEVKGLEEGLNVLIDTFERLNEARFKRGSIDLEIPEAFVQLNKDGTVLDITARVRLTAHKLIEECMLIANQCAAKFLKEKARAGVYRVHEEPEAKKAREFIEFLSLQGINAIEILGKKWERKQKQKKGQKTKETEGAVIQDPEDYAILLKRIRKDRGENDPIVQALQPMMLRTLKQARYTNQPKGHFALAEKDYTHFTSPIRRYPDLMVHRLIKEALGVKAAFDPSTDLEQRCQHCSDQERLAMDAERKLIDIKKCRFMENKLGEEFDAFVTGVTEKGIFCQITGHFVDGLINADRFGLWGGFQFNSSLMCYKTSGNKIIHLGHRIKVKLVSVDIKTRRIDFEPMELME